MDTTLMDGFVASTTDLLQSYLGGVFHCVLEVGPIVLALMAVSLATWGIRRLLGVGKAARR